MLPRVSEARLQVLLRSQQAEIRRPGHTWGMAPTRGAELTASGLLGAGSSTLGMLPGRGG